MVLRHLRIAIGPALVCAAAAGYASQTARVIKGFDLPNADTFIERVIELTNAERSKCNLPPLRHEATLDKSSTWLAQDMADNNYFEHTDRLGRSIGRRMTAFGYESWSMVGENIAAGCKSPEDVVQAWMQSPGHRENILRPDFNEIGIGFVQSSKNPYHYFWVQDFGKR